MNTFGNFDTSSITNFLGLSGEQRDQIEDSDQQSNLAATVIQKNVRSLLVWYSPMSRPLFQ